jgi:class 3 adenylate cyclase
MKEITILLILVIFLGIQPFLYAQSEENQSEAYMKDFMEKSEELIYQNIDPKQIKNFIQKSKDEFRSISERKQKLEVNLMSNRLRNNIRPRSEEKKEIYQTEASDVPEETIKETVLNNPNAEKEKELQLLSEIEEKKIAEIAALTNALNYQSKALELSELKLRNQFYVGAAFFVILSLVMLNLYRGNRQKKKMNRLLADEKQKTEQERDKSDELLLNILPFTVAQELKSQGKTPVRTYALATVLFTDFKGFTSVAEKMSPTELVEELDSCFAKFDEIITQFKLEKIKTIGDAYMCVGGIPAPNESNPIAAVLAGLSIQKFMLDKRNEKLAQGQDYWQCRLGINSGELIAGVIGRKKFAYDVWGDTVNTGSRMESSGEVGKVNISGKTYQLVKEYFEVEYRGKVDAKGKGEIDMYFVNRIKETYSADMDGLTANQDLLDLLV